MAKSINVRLSDDAHKILRDLAYKSGLTNARVLELALKSLRADAIAEWPKPYVTPVTTVEEVRSLATHVGEIPPANEDFSGSEGDSEGNDGAGSRAFPESTPSEPADLHTQDTERPPAKDDEDDLLDFLASFDGES